MQIYHQSLCHFVLDTDFLCHFYAIREFRHLSVYDWQVYTTGSQKRTVLCSLPQSLQRSDTFVPKPFQLQCDYGALQHEVCQACDGVCCRCEG